ncbi:MAG: glycosyltransferase [Candidatus Rehaiarchaeum fermentans]|nr:glycosyltransferase [Candidatus Rehaiarchaeum fermentans]
MKIAIVVPWAPVIKGNSYAASFARALSELNQKVDFIVHTMKADLEEDFKNILGGKVNLIILNRSDNESINFYKYFKLQYFSKIDEDIAEFILTNGDYNLLVLISNEGKKIPMKIKKKLNNYSSKTLITAIIVMELIDYSFDLNKEGIPSHVRKLFLFLKPIFRYVERKRLNSFDLVYSISNWTSNNLLKLYGIKSKMSLPLYDDKNFKMEDTIVKENQIAVPTASLNNHGLKLLLRLQNDGIPLVAFGPKNANGLKNLGFLSMEEMRRLISKSKATLFYFDYEALGLIPLESLSLGTPVITIPKQGPYEELKDNRFVYFFNSYDSLLKICRDLIQVDQDTEYRLACSNSVNDFRSEIVASRFLKDIQNYIENF